MNMIPTTTGAARAVFVVLPEFKGKLDGSASASRRPTYPDRPGLHAQRDTTEKRSTRSLKAASRTRRLKGVLDYTDEPLVSIDLMHTPRELDRRQPRNRGARRQVGPRASAGTTTNGASRFA